MSLAMRTFIMRVLCAQSKICLFVDFAGGDEVHTGIPDIGDEDLPHFHRELDFGLVDDFHDAELIAFANGATGLAGADAKQLSAAFDGRGQRATGIADFLGSVNGASGAAIAGDVEVFVDVEFTASGADDAS